MPDHNPPGHDRTKTADGAHGLAADAGSGDHRPLTPRQVRILAFVRDFASGNPYPPAIREITNGNPHPPAIREITNGCGLSSASAAFHNLRRLEEEEFLTRVPGSARSTVLTPRGRPALPAGPIAVAQDSPVAGAS